MVINSKGLKMTAIINANRTGAKKLASKNSKCQLHLYRYSFLKSCHISPMKRNAITAVICTSCDAR